MRDERLRKRAEIKKQEDCRKGVGRPWLRWEDWPKVDIIKAHVEEKSREKANNRQ